MTIAIIIAGGSGVRMGYEIPKQFIPVEGKPVVMHTLDNFEHHAEIDAIEIVCLEGWQEEMQRLVRQYGISKVRWIVPGGSSAQESIRNGVFHLDGICSPDDIVIIHDGIRPLIEPFVLTDVIAKCREFGNGVTSMPYNEQIFLVDKEQPATSTAYIPRETLRRVATPQAYTFKTLLWAYRKAFEEKIGIYGSSYTNTMMVELGVRLHFAAGSDKNIKLTTPDDLELFKAYRKMKADE